jgi:hypothetical protein
MDPKEVTALVVQMDQMALGLQLLEVGAKGDALLDECTHIAASLRLGGSFRLVLGLRNRLSLWGLNGLILLRGRGIHNFLAVVLL